MTIDDTAILAAMDLLRVIRDDPRLARLSPTRRLSARQEIVTELANKVGELYDIDGAQIRQTLLELLTDQWGQVTPEDIRQDERDLRRAGM